jgi:hypothetical protein
MIGFGRLYVVEFHNVTISAQQDLFYVKPAADKICVVEAVYLGVTGGASDAGDAQEELLDVEMIYLPATVTVGSGGSSFTPTPKSVNDAAAGFTGRINDTTKASSSGTALNRHSDGWNSRVPYEYLPPPEHRDLVANAAAMVFRLNTTPADALAANGTMLVREMP